MTGSVITFSAGSDSGSVAPAFALAKSAAISSALSWRFGSLFVVSATASSATGLGSTTGSGSGICGVSLTGSGSGTCGVSTTGSGSFTGMAQVSVLTHSLVQIPVQVSPPWPVLIVVRRSFA